jgi:hypothetical protein
VFLKEFLLTEILPYGSTHEEYLSSLNRLLLERFHEIIGRSVGLKKNPWKPNIKPKTRGCWRRVEENKIN